jgi:hypothetical protein
MMTTIGGANTIGGLFGELGFKLAKMTYLSDEKKREEFTQQFVADAQAQFPEYNVVIIHTAHETWGTWVHEHHELGMAIGTCGYDAYFSIKGQGFSLRNNGDGGYINWAFAGEFNRDGNFISAVEYAAS